MAQKSTPSQVSMMVLFDHEEVGSTSTTGAASPIMGEAVRRISRALSPYMVESFMVDDELYSAAPHKFPYSGRNLSRRGGGCPHRQ